MDIGQRQSERMDFLEESTCNGVCWTNVVQANRKKMEDQMKLFVRRFREWAPILPRNWFESVFSKSFILSLAVLALPAIPSGAHAGVERQYVKESCSELTSQLLNRSDAAAPSTDPFPYEGSWVSWNGTIVSVDQTLWGAEIRVSCSNDPKDKSGVVLSLDAEPAPSLGIQTGKKISFTGRMSGLAETGFVTIKDVEFVPEPVKTAKLPPPPPPAQETLSAGQEETGRGATSGPQHGAADAKSLSQQGPADIVRAYYAAVQSGQIDRAVSLYCASKRPNVKRGVLEAISKDTQYFAIDRMQCLETGPGTAKVTVELRHKKINKPEEYWEVWMDMVSEQGQWRILSTPGKRIR